jgi:nitrite reductase/ring-hydroxylating ferredoxin subunit
MDAPNNEFTCAGRLEELKAKGRLVLHGGRRPILVLYDRGRVFALDNRCPHMGFPLERGSIEDGILTCHWHHTRFDLESGCTFDLWADDVPICPVEVRNGEVWVKTTFVHTDPAAHWHQRLADGHGARRVAADCDGEAPRRERASLGSWPPPATLKRWLRHWTKVRHREAAERTLLTGIVANLSPAVLADALLAAETERAFADSGHSLDFINKAFECLDLIGWEHARAVLPTVVGQMVAARGAEESTAWRQPVDLVALCEQAGSELPGLFVAGRAVHGWAGHAMLARELLGDDPRLVKKLKQWRELFRSGVAFGRCAAIGMMQHCIADNYTCKNRRSLR